MADAYADLLAGRGVEHGLLGPREAERLWSRHLLNCAAVAELVPPRAQLVDVGSGAGLPGLVLAIARPDLHVELVEPLARRSEFLQDAVAELGLAQVRVTRARAEDLVSRPVDADVVTARAVAPLDRLAGWCLPLLRPGGVLLALKGARAGDELAAAGPTLARLGGRDAAVVSCGQSVVNPPTTVVRIVCDPGAGARPSTPPSRRRRPRR